MSDPSPGPDRIRLVVLFGGQSAEHDVSRVSARHVLAAADPERYEVRPVAITKQGEWVLAEAAARALVEGLEHLPEALPAEGPAVDPLPMLAGDRAGAAAEAGPATVVLPLLHGPLGEDGTVQGLLELAGVPYVGCGVLASALAMDKAMAKEVFAGAGIPQARFVALHADEIEDATPGRLVDELGLPIFVKPANMGSSIGVSKAATLAELADAVALALSYDEVIVCEEAVDGREIECAVLGNRTPRASLPGEIVPGADFYDFDDKYRDGTADLLIPAPLSDDVTTELRALAVEAYRALRCEGMARVDFFYEEGGRGLLVNEINTIPGFTPISMYPKMWEATGLPYGELVDELVLLALERHARRRRRVD
ncbi:MAG: D-alanine--D-alanine ligase family protein [Acidimicrobiales bacterium]